MEAQGTDIPTRHPARRALPRKSLKGKYLMTQPLNKSSLTQTQTRLVELMQSLNFGRLEDLQVHNGEPVFSPPPRIIQRLKMGADNSSRPETGYSDFLLKHGVVELLGIIARLRQGEIRSIEVRGGLPVTAEIEWAEAGDIAS